MDPIVTSPVLNPFLTIRTAKLHMNKAVSQGRGIGILITTVHSTVSGRYHPDILEAHVFVHAIQDDLISSILHRRLGLGKFVKEQHTGSARNGKGAEHLRRGPDHIRVVLLYPRHSPV